MKLFIVILMLSYQEFSSEHYDEDPEALANILQYILTLVNARDRNKVPSVSSIRSVSEDLLVVSQYNYRDADIFHPDVLEPVWLRIELAVQDGSATRKVCCESAADTNSKLNSYSTTVGPVLVLFQDACKISALTHLVTARSTSINLGID